MSSGSVGIFLKGESLMKQNLRRALLATALAGLSFMGVSAIGAEGTRAVSGPKKVHRSVSGPYNWIPVGAAVDSNTSDPSALDTDGGNYLGGDIISPSVLLKAANGGPVDRVDSDSNVLFNGSFAPTSASSSSNVLNIYGNLYSSPDATGLVDGGIQVPLKVDTKAGNDVVIDASSVDVIVNIKEDVIIEPLFAGPSGNTWDSPATSFADFQTRNDVAAGSALASPARAAHIQFKADGNNITVNVDHDVTFRGRTTDATSGSSDYVDMLVSFIGSGTTTFKMKGGATVSFDGDINTSGAVAVDENGLLLKSDANYGQPNNNAGGTKVLICMDGANTDAHKVLFQRKALDSFPLLNTTVKVGCNSVITFLSTDRYGYGTGEDASGTITTGQAALAFDASTGNDTVGRMVLFIKGAYKNNNASEEENAGTENESYNEDFGRIVTKYPFNDGAVVVAGHRVSSLESPADVKTYNFSKPAGNSAVLRVVDDLYYSAHTSGAYDPALVARRGLLVVNDVQSHGKLMADPYWDKYNQSSATFPWLPTNSDNAKKNCRRGFVLGVNGVVDVYHNTFLAHASGSLNDVDPLAYNDFAAINTPASSYLLKARNPSAFIVDGLDPDIFLDGVPADSSSVSGPNSDFHVADPRLQNQPMRAKVNLRGSGSMYFKHAGSSHSGNILGYHQEIVDGVTFADINWTKALVMKDNDALTGGLNYRATYNGYNLSVDGYNCAAAGSEGLHVLDVEGELMTAGSPAADAAGDRTYAAGPLLAQGVFGAAGLQLDYRGIEVNGDDGTANVARPLDVTGAVTYPRYNKPCLFFNNNAMFSNVRFSHSTPTHFVDGLPVNSEPAITGGERFWFGVSYWDGEPTDSSYKGFVLANRTADANRFRLPEIQLYNATLELHESLNASGVRFVAKDMYDSRVANDSPTFGFRGPASSDANNNASTVQFFDHGPATDTHKTGHGRIFLCGSSLNTMADGSNNYVSESCSWNIFKHNFPNVVADRYQPNNSATVALNITNGDEFPATLQAAINNASDSAAYADRCRAHHLFLFAQPKSLAEQVDANGNAFSYADELVRTDASGSVLNPICNLSVGWPDVEQAANIPNPAADLTTGVPLAEGGKYPHVFPYASWGATGEEWFVSNMRAINDTLPAAFSHAFTPDAVNVAPLAKLNINGSFIYFGSFDADGNSVKVPVQSTVANSGGDDVTGVVYANHGGQINVGRAANGQYAQAGFATMLMQRMWNDYNADGTERVSGMCGQVNLPANQVMFDTNYAVQPYNLTKDMFEARRDDTYGYVRLAGYNADNAVAGDRAGIPHMLINWRNRDVEASAFGIDYPTGDIVDNLAPRSTVAHKAIAKMAKMRPAVGRSVNSIAEPQARPLDLLYVGPGDDIRQMRVAGATASDPFVLDVSGDGVRPLVARVREFVSQKTETGQITDHFISEGAHAILFGEYGGHIGLGSRSWNEHSLNAWNLLGRDNVAIMPLGDCTVDVNSNLVVTDAQALVATPNFGENAVNRITFYSQEPREIRVPAGQTLDLSSFGQAAHQQQIAFGGQVRLVFEVGATLRMPSLDAIAEAGGAGVVLYFNDESQLVFEGDQTAQNYVPFSDLTSPSNTAPVADSRIRILGAGQIWANKNARIEVNGNVFVGVEADAQTPDTNITISLQRQGSMLIGSDNIGGGAFQVGNPVAVEGQTVAFNLTLNGPNALFHIDREGFFGLGAGVINKFGVPNGSGDSAPLADANPVLVGGTTPVVLADGKPLFTPVQLKANPSTGDHYVANYLALSSGVWVVHPLHNVASVTVNLQNGVFEHKNIADGNSAMASLMAVGPADEFNWSQAGSGSVSVRGGGNLMLVPAASKVFNPKGLVATNIWDYAGQMTLDLVSSINAGSGESYNIMASGQMLKDKNAGAGLTAGSAAQFFSFIGYQSYETQGRKRVVASSTIFQDQMAYALAELDGTQKYAAGSQIIRDAAPAYVTGGGDMADAFEVGALLAQGASEPLSFAIGR